MSKRARNSQRRLSDVSQSKNYGKRTKSSRRINGNLYIQIDRAKEKIDLGTQEGTILLTTRKGRFIAEKCSCSGLNENCFKCGGLGLYPFHQTDMEDTPASPLRRISGGPQQISSYSNDSRGDNWAIRETGNFGSTPLHDDHDD